MLDNLIYVCVENKNLHKILFAINEYYLNDQSDKIKNTYFNLSILQTDFVSISKDVLIKKYKFTNENTIDLNVNFLVYSKLLSSLKIFFLFALFNLIFEEITPF